MVKKECLHFILIGGDARSKDQQFKALCQQYLPKSSEYLNCDILHAKDISVNDLQELLLCLPVRAKKRIVLIRSAEDLRQDLRDFIFAYSKKPYEQCVLVLDFSSTEKDGIKDFIRSLSAFSRIYRFRERQRDNTFTLNRQIHLKNPDAALKILTGLLREGEKPERVMGGLRFAWERDIAEAKELRRRLRLLLFCDNDIKTGRLKPDFALEKLVISLCASVKL